MEFTRRSFLKVLSVAGTGRAALTGLPAEAPAVTAREISSRLALLGGAPVRSKSFPSWPVFDETDEARLIAGLRSRSWNRAELVDQFEREWAKRLGARHVIATNGGTGALYAALYALGVGPGDEVIVPPYTFVATIHVVLLHRAIPIFVDTDRRSFQIDASKIEAALTDRTACILPVHLGGNAANMDTILEVAGRRNIPVLEDACQAHLGEWKSQPLGTLGDAGCFSFQATKNLNSGEGGAIVTNNDELARACASFHDSGRPYRVAENGNLVVGSAGGFQYIDLGDNRRMTELQGALILQQLSRLEEQSRTRDQNATYLTSMLREIPGIAPAEMYEGCTRNGYHLYMFRYDPQGFAGVSRARFLQALRAEGIPCMGGYGPLNKEPFLEQSFRSAGFRRVYGDEMADSWKERSHCPENDRLCEEAVWMTQNQFLGPRSDMEAIVGAIRKIRDNSVELAAGNDHR